MGDRTFLWVAIAVAALAIAYFLFLRKPKEEKLPTKDEEPRLPSKGARTARGGAEEGAAKPKADQPRSEKKAKPAREAEPAPRATDVDVDDMAAPADVERPAPPSVRRPPVPSRGSEPEPSPSPRRTKDVAGLRKGLARARESEGFFGRLKAVFGGRKEIDPALVEQMEEVLLTSDVGVKTTAELMGAIRESLSKGELKDDARVWEALRTKALDIIDLGSGGLTFPARPTVVMVVGVNGSGKTTTIGKLATRLTAQGKKVVLAAGDTFRAAATQQLVLWAKRAGCEVVTGAEGANSGAVIFDAIQKAKDIGADVVLADTAGRLHTKSNLMDELKKIGKTIGKAMDGAPHETLLVLDSTNGQNASQQAALFKEAMPLTGLVLTKLDGTAKGGVVLGICAEHEIPVRYIGVGERPEDLRDFNAEEFVEALLGTGTDAADEAA